MAMVATTVSNWASARTWQNHIVADIFIADTLDPLASYMTPNVFQGTTNTLRYGNSVWATGINTVSKVGSTATNHSKAEMTMALHILATHLDGYLCCWEGCNLEGDGTSLQGSICRVFIAEEHR